MAGTIGDDAQQRTAADPGRSFTSFMPAGDK
jgi:hypothetical protein